MISSSYKGFFIFLLIFITKSLAFPYVEPNNTIIYQYPFRLSQYNCFIPQLYKYHNDKFIIFCNRDGKYGNFIIFLYGVTLDNQNYVYLSQIAMRNAFIKYMININTKEESSNFISLFSQYGIASNRLIFIIGDDDCIKSHIIYHMDCNIEPINSFNPLISICHNYFNYKSYSDIVTYSIKDLTETLVKISKNEFLYRQLLFKRLKQINNYKDLIESTITTVTYKESSNFHISYFPLRYLNPVQLEIRNLFIQIMKKEVICKSNYFILNINSIYLKPTFSISKMISTIIDNKIINNNDYILIKSHLVYSLLYFDMNNIKLYEIIRKYSINSNDKEKYFYSNLKLFSLTNDIKYINYILKMISELNNNTIDFIKYQSKLVYIYHYLLYK